MAIRTVITRGFGQGATVAKVAARGFIDDSAPPAPSADDRGTTVVGIGIGVTLRMGIR